MNTCIPNDKDGSRRGNEAGLYQRQPQPPPHVGGYAGSEISVASPATQDFHNSTLPADLREWVGTSELISFVLEAVQALYWIDREESGPDLESSQPQLILGLLAYSYATGLYPADAITRRMATDPALRYLGLNSRFTLRQLVLFRSQNRELLRRCLGQVLRRAWEIRFGKSFPGATNHTRFEIAFRNYFNDEAAERINRALRVDHNAMAGIQARPTDQLLGL